MNRQTEFEDRCEVDDVPVSPSLAVERKNRFGSVSGLDDDELADPHELERVLVLEMWGPVLALPVRKRGSWVQPNIDEDGSVDWGAFGTVDFSRLVPEFDKARYKADKLREELRNELILASTVSRRLPQAQYKVLKQVTIGVLDVDDIANEDMRALAKIYLRTKRLRREIAELEESGRARRGRQTAEPFG